MQTTTKKPSHREWGVGPGAGSTLQSLRVAGELHPLSNLNECEAIGHAFEQFAREQDLTLTGQLHLAWTFQVTGRELSVVDLVNVPYALMQHDRVNVVRLEAAGLSERKANASSRSTGAPRVVAIRTDRAMPLLLDLYGMGRINAAMVLVALGVTPSIREGP